MIRFTVYRGGFKTRCKTASEVAEAWANILPIVQAAHDAAKKLDWYNDRSEEYWKPKIRIMVPDTTDKAGLNNWSFYPHYSRTGEFFPLFFLHLTAAEAKELHGVFKAHGDLAMAEMVAKELIGQQRKATLAVAQKP